MPSDGHRSCTGVVVNCLAPRRYRSHVSTAIPTLDKDPSGMRGRPRPHRADGRAASVRACVEELRAGRTGQQRCGEAGGLGRPIWRGDARRYEQFEQCLEEVDAVYIALPNSMHVEYAIRAAHAGVHVLCEKPLAVTGGECERIIAACREADVRVMTAYRLHFERMTLWALDQVRAGRLGDLRYLTSAFSMRARAGRIRTRVDRRRHAVRHWHLLHQRGADILCERTRRGDCLLD